MNRQNFLKKADAYLLDTAQVKNDALVTYKLNRKIDLAQTYFDKYDLARQRAAYLKNKALENTDKLLSKFEFELNNTKVKVLWAVDAQDALQEIANIGNTHKLPLYFDEVEKVQEIEKQHKSVTYSITKATNFDEPYIALTQADFIVADSSSIVCVNQTNDGKKAQAGAKVQIFLAGIDSIIQSYTELELMLSLQSTNKYGEPLPSNICIYHGNKLNENDALRDDIYLILLDNGRTQIMSDNEQRSVLNCIHCDACSRACPVSQFAGKEAYGTVYTGPYGALVSPHLEKNDELSHLAFASTLCGTINEVCPMNIDLSSFLVYSRRNAVRNKRVSKTDNLTIYLWKNAVIKRSNMDKGGAKVKGFMLKQILRKSWGNKREMPVVAPKSFNQLWRERKEFGK